MIKGSIHQEDTNSVYTKRKKKKKALIYEVKNTGEIRKYMLLLLSRFSPVRLCATP